MKRILQTLIVASALLSSLAARAGYHIDPTYLDGSNGYTNGAGAGVSNYTVVAGVTNVTSVIQAASTNFYNLYGVTYNTNLWPAITFSPGGTFPPYRQMGIYTQFGFMSSNGAAVNYRFAASLDGTHWISNVFVLGVSTNGAATSIPRSITNYDTVSYPFVSLQQIENPGAGAITNLFLISDGKPGL